MDSKKLFDLVSNITGATKENPLPECSSDKELANQFAEFFLSHRSGKYVMNWMVFQSTEHHPVLHQSY